MSNILEIKCNFLISIIWCIATSNSCKKNWYSVEIHMISNIWIILYSLQHKHRYKGDIVFKKEFEVHVSLKCFSHSLVLNTLNMLLPSQEWFCALALNFLCHTTEIQNIQMQRHPSSRRISFSYKRTNWLKHIISMTFTFLYEACKEVLVSNLKCSCVWK